MAGGERRAQLERLRGKAAIAQAKLAYLAFREQLRRRSTSPCWRARARGRSGRSGRARPPRTRRYPDVYYVEALIGPDTVNTMPPATLAAYKDHGHPEDRLGAGGRSRAQRARPAGAVRHRHGRRHRSASRARASRRSPDRGTACSTPSSRRREALRLATRTKARLGAADRAVTRALGELTADRVGERLWAEDPTLWKRLQGIPGTGSNAWLGRAGRRRPARSRRSAPSRARSATRVSPTRWCAEPVPTRCPRRSSGAASAWRAGGSTSACSTPFDPASVARRRRRAAEPARTLYVLCATGSMAIEPAFRVLWERAGEALGDGRRRALRRDRHAGGRARVAGGRARLPPHVQDARRRQRTLGGALRSRAGARRRCSAPTSASCSSGRGAWQPRAAPSSRHGTTRGCGSAPPSARSPAAGGTSSPSCCPTAWPPSAPGSSSSSPARPARTVVASSRSSARRSARPASTARIASSCTSGSAEARTAPSRHSPPPVTRS